VKDMSPGQVSPDQSFRDYAVARSVAVARGSVIIGGMERAERARLAGFALEAGCEARTYKLGAEVLEAMRRTGRAILFLSANLEDMTAQDLLGSLKKQGLSVITIVIVPPMAIMAAVAAIKAGAGDVQEHPVSKQMFLKSLAEALTQQQRRELLQSH